MHPALQSTMMVYDDNMIRTFPILQVEVKIRVPDQLMGRLIGKNGVGLKKIMEETTTHITISDARQHEAQHYQQTAEERIITIRGNNWNAVALAEKNVQQKLRQFLDQDMNINTGGGQQYYHGPGVIMNPVENIGPYIAPGSVPAQMLQRDNTYAANASAYNALPMGVSPQSFYIQNPAAAVAANYSIPTGHHYGHAMQQPTVPSSVFIKSRVYVPNQIVGMLIGSKGQNIKGIQNESGALINIEGDHPKKFIKKEVQQIENNSNKPESSSNNNEDYGKEATPPKSDVTNTDGGSNGLDNMKSIANVEPVTDESAETKTAIETSGSEESTKNAIIVGGEQNANDAKVVEEEGSQEGSNNKEEAEKKEMMAEHTEQQQQDVDDEEEDDKDEEEDDDEDEDDQKNEEEDDDEDDEEDDDEDDEEDDDEDDEEDDDEDDEEDDDEDDEEDDDEDEDDQKNEEEDDEDDDEEEDADDDKDDNIEDDASSASSSSSSFSLEVNGSSAPQEEHHNHNCAPGSHDSSQHHQFNGGDQNNKRNNATNYNANNNGNGHLQNPDQRGVFIQGYEHQVNKALIWVYQKVAENQQARAEEITLTCEVVVPSKVIGRIIGRQGQNVKQLQQTSGAQIKVPDDVNQNDKVDAAVRVIGCVSAVQHVQNHFGRLIIEAEWRESKEFDERDRRSRFREGSR